MLRITSSRKDGTSWIQLEGKLVGPWVEECRALCTSESERGQRLALDLSEVRFADRAGVELLRRLAEIGSVVRSSGYTAELLRDGGSVNTPEEEGRMTMDASRNGRKTTAGMRAGALLTRLHAGAAEAREELVRRHGAALLATARCFLPHGDEAIAALTETFHAAFRGARECPAEAELAAWLHRLVVDACVARLAPAVGTEDAIDALLPAFGALGGHARPVEPWSTRAPSAELHAEVRERIHELPPPYRVVVLLADLEGLPAREIAARLGLPPAEVTARLRRARQALITLLAPTPSPRVAG